MGEKTRVLLCSFIIMIYSTNIRDPKGERTQFKAAKQVFLKKKTEEKYEKRKKNN